MRDVVVASVLQKGQAPPWVLHELAGARIWLTFITVGELAKWTAVRLRYQIPLLTLNTADFSDFGVHHGLSLLSE